MSQTVREVCVACGHGIDKYFNDVTGKARCLVVSYGKTTKGVIGLPWSMECPCCDFSMPTPAQTFEASREPSGGG